MCYESDIAKFFIILGGLIATIHMFKTKRGFLNLRKLFESEQSIYSENWMRSIVEGVGIYRLILKIDFQLDIENTFYVPSFSRNFISFLDYLLLDMISILIFLPWIFWKIIKLLILPI